MSVSSEAAVESSRRGLPPQAQIVLSLVLLVLVGCLGESAAKPPLGPRGWAPGELPWALGSGATTAALATAYGLGAEGLGLRRLVAETAADNVASNKILESLGFTRWGVEDAATAPDNSIGPAAHWELLSPPQG